MSGYTVTITPSGRRSGPQTTVHVDTTSGTARVTELTVRPGGNGISPGALPAIDLALLVAAFAPASAPAITAAPAAPSAAAKPARPAAPARQSRGRRTATPVPATGSRARRRTEAPPAAKTTRGRRRAATSGVAPTASRAYRRMPAQDDVVAAWNDSRSATALAAHFDVPRHTAQGWLRRLREIGVIEPAS